MNILLLYYTKTGHTLEAAEAIEKGLTGAGGSVRLMSAKDFDPKEMEKCDMLIVGSPCWGGSMGAGISTPILKALNRLTKEVEGKPCVGFSVNGGKGGRNTVAAMGKILKEKGCASYIEGPVLKAGVPLSLWKGPSVTAEGLEECMTFGMEIVKHSKG